MNRLWGYIKKDFLVLVRDQAGLGLIFLMPVALVLVMTLIQDTSFRKLEESQITLLFLDNDKDSLGIKLKAGLERTGYFKVIARPGNEKLDEESLQQMVAGGTYQFGIVVRKGSTAAINERGRLLARQAILGEGSAEPDSTQLARIIIYFDPAIKMSFKVSVRNALENFTSKIEAGILFRALSDELADYLPEPPAPLPENASGIVYEEIFAANKHTEIIPNSVQHNVPAWTIFAMFFIIIPLTGNIVREKEEGLATRLRIMPGNHFQWLGAKVFVYLGVGLIQFTLLLVFSKFVFPVFDLPRLVLGPEKGALALMAIATALAAIGYSLLVGTAARTHDQAAVFGMVSVIILAAIGGIWVPVFMMPGIMQAASIISPLNWSLDGFYDILLRGSGIRGITGNFTALMLFFIVTLVMAVILGIRSREK